MNPTFGPPLPRAFFERPCAVVARELVGCVLVRALPGGERIAGRLVEVEAYLGDGSDPGSHSHNGPTPRNLTMFGAPGRLYAYRSYGIHTCANVVCEPAGVGAAVLLRSAEPLLGQVAMRGLRGLAENAPVKLVASGPGRLAQAFGIGLEHDGRSALRGELSLRAPGKAAPPVTLEVGQRVGLTKGVELPYRFHAKGSACVSAWRPGGRRRRAD